MSAPFPPRCSERYTIGDRIAEGACGAVFQATHRALGRPVALKLLHAEASRDPSVVDRFIAEAKITAALSHPHLVKVLDYDVEDGVPWIAYEFIPGKSLRSRIAAGRSEWRDAVKLCAQIASALAAAHEAGVLHRDVKPENVLEAGPLDAKVTDFGIARWAGSEVRTQAGMIVGTPAYMAPEMTFGAPATTCSDLYALGAVLYELITGERAFTGPTVVAVLEAHSKQPVPRLDARRADLPPELVDLGSRLLAKAPEFRPQRAAAVAAELEALLEPPPSLVTPAPALPPRAPPAPLERKQQAPPVRRPAKARARVAAAAAIAVGLGCALAVVARRRLPGNPQLVNVSPPPPSPQLDTGAGFALLARQDADRDAVSAELESIKPLLLNPSREAHEQAARLARKHLELTRGQQAALDDLSARLGEVAVGEPLARTMLRARVHAAGLRMRLHADRLAQRARMADRTLAEQLDSAFSFGRLVELDHDVQHAPVLVGPLVTWLESLFGVARRLAAEPAFCPAEGGLLFRDVLMVGDQFNVYRFRGEAQDRFEAETRDWSRRIEGANPETDFKPGALFGDMFDLGITGDANRIPETYRSARDLLARAIQALPQCAAELRRAEEAVAARSTKRQ